MFFIHDCSMGRQRLCKDNSPLFFSSLGNFFLLLHLSFLPTFPLLPHYHIFPTASQFLCLLSSPSLFVPLFCLSTSPSHTPFSFSFLGQWCWALVLLRSCCTRRRKINCNRLMSHPCVFCGFCFSSFWLRTKSLSCFSVAVCSSLTRHNKH